jgi:hypothetical protein
MLEQDAFSSITDNILELLVILETPTGLHDEMCRAHICTCIC